MINGILHGNWKHGEGNYSVRTVEYRSWCSMMERCYNSGHPSFKDYGDRGILVCERWHDYNNFLADIGRRPKGKKMLGRIDNNGNYEPNNCRWETSTQQNRNKRTTKLTLVEAREIRMLWDRGYRQIDLAKEFGVSHSMISVIVNNKGWKEDAE